MNVVQKLSCKNNLTPQFYSKRSTKTQNTIHTNQITDSSDRNLYSQFLILDRKFDNHRDITQNTLLQKQIPPKIKIKLVDWLISVCWNYKINNSALFLAVYLLEQYFKKNAIDKKIIQAISLTCLFIATKYTDSSKLKLSDFLNMCKNIYSADLIIELQEKILKMMDYDLEVPSLYKYYEAFLWTQSQVMKKQQWTSKIQFWLEIKLLKEEQSCRKSKKILIQLINLAKQKKNKNSYQIEEMIKFAKNLRNLEYKTVFQKYLSKFDVFQYLQEFQL